MCIVSAYFGLNTLWNGEQKTIAADIGLRLVAGPGMWWQLRLEWRTFLASATILSLIFPTLVLAGSRGDDWRSDHCIRIHPLDPLPRHRQRIIRSLSELPWWGGYEATPAACHGNSQ